MSSWAKLGWRWFAAALCAIWLTTTPASIPVTGIPPEALSGILANPAAAIRQGTVPSLSAFSQGLPTGESDRVVGVFVKGKLALRIVEQPAGQPGYVTTQPDAASHFALAQPYGTMGLIAHNTLAGQAFFSLEDGDRVLLLSENGTRTTFSVIRVRHLQALSPLSPFSEFRDLESASGSIPAHTLFTQVYGGNYPLVLQTCIAQNGNDSWGRLFVLALPVPPDVDSFTRGGAPEFAWPSS